MPSFQNVFLHFTLSAIVKSPSYSALYIFLICFLFKDSNNFDILIQDILLICSNNKLLLFPLVSLKLHYTTKYVLSAYINLCIGWYTNDY